MNKKNLIILLVVFSLVSIIIAGCGSTSVEQKDTDAGGGEVNNNSDGGILTVYTARSEELNNAVIPNFEKDTGIVVETIVGGTGEVLKRIESERDNPMADILWAGDKTVLAPSKDLFMEYTSTENDNMFDDFKNAMGVFSPAFADPMALIVNKNLTEGIKIEGYQDLLNPELKGKIAAGDPTNSNSAFQHLISILYAMGDGDPMSDKAWDYIDDFIKNLDGKILGSSGQVHKGVADGEYAVGLTWEEPVLDYIKNGAPVDVVFPIEGSVSVYPGQSVQIVKNCKNPENAKKFVDYVLSEKIQGLVGSEYRVRPLRKGAEIAPYMTPTEEIKLAKNYDAAWVSENKTAILERYQEHLEKSLD